jgi:hypothetical protein
VVLALGGAAASGCSKRPVQPGGTAGGALGGLGGGIVGSGGGGGQSTTGSAGATGTGGAAGIPLPCMGLSDSRLVVADQRILRLTSNEIVNTVSDLFGAAEAQALVDSQMFALTSRVNRHFPPADGEDQTVNDTNVIQLNNMAQHVGDFVTANFATLTSCGTASPDGCAAIYLGKLAARAYRRTLTTAEQTRFSALYTKLRAPQIVNGYQVTFTAEEATGYAVQALLSSPQMLWRWELGDPAMAPTSAAGIPLTDAELATHVAFFLTDHLPDEALTSAAAAGTLRANLASHVERLLASQVARNWLRETMEYYFLLNQLPASSIDPGRIPIFSPALLADMGTEASMFLDEALWRGNLTDLLLSRTTFLNTNLATNIYAVQIPTGAPTTFVRTTLPDDHTRSGLLTNAGFLAARARTDGQDLVSRGKAVSAAVVCAHLSAPPTGPPPILPGAKPLDQQTGQEQVAQRAAVAVCNECHSTFDPYGLALENYDSVGRYRTTYDNLGGQLIDASAALPAIAGGGTVTDAVEMAQKLAASPAFINCMARAVLQEALVDLSAYVEVPIPPQQAGCATTDLVQRYQSVGGKTFGDLVRATAATPAFVLRKVAP